MSLPEKAETVPHQGRVCILLRVYNRIDDLVNCIDIIRDTWKSNTYYILVVFNGEGSGYKIPEMTKSKIDHLITIENNIGHFSGNSMLLLEGLQHIPDDCAYTVILEADTWIYGDGLYVKYADRLERTGAVWASAQFFRYIRNLATDFAIIRTCFIKQYPAVFTFNETPEYYVANYLHRAGQDFLYIPELMPVNLPKYIRKFPFAPTGRFFMFPEGEMVTHHVESLKNGMIEKKRYFNLVAGKKYFNIPGPELSKVTKLLFFVSVAITAFLPYKSWFIKTKD